MADDRDDDRDVASTLRYARGLLRKAATSGASFVEINVDTLRYLVENRRALNDRLRWAEDRAAKAEAAATRHRASLLTDEDDCREAQDNTPSKGPFPDARRG